MDDGGDADMSALESPVYRFGITGRYIGGEWRMGIRRVGSGDSGIVISDDKTYKSNRTATNAAQQKNKHWPRHGWEYVAIRVEIRLVEVPE